MIRTFARYFAAPSPTSDLSRHAEALRMFRGTPAEAGRWARNTVLHVQDYSRMGPELSAAQISEFTTRSAAQIVDRTLARGDTPLSLQREPLQKMIGNCYHFALVACALLRHVGIPARVRYGFAPYLEPGKYEDHCLCEVLMGSSWRPFDPRYALEIDDEDPPTFLNGAEAWLRCRAGAADPQLFGSYQLVGRDESRGWFYLRNNLLRDYAALCKVELHPWDWWGLMLASDGDHQPELLDELAQTMRDDLLWAERSARLEADPRVGPGDAVTTIGELAGHFENKAVKLTAAW
jgi:hypothetical protein